MNIFISYGDTRYKESLNRIVRQAKRVGIFDKIIKYTPKDLPDYIKSSPLFAFSRGGGYWCWKPYIIYHTLQNCKEGDIVFYADAGCSLVKESQEWQEFLKLAETYNAIFFQYRNGVDYGKGFGGRSVAIKNWIKPAAMNYFLQFIDEGFLDYGKIWGGFMLFRKSKDVSIILDQWYKITLFHPELVIDPYGAELDLSATSSYIHRHDQSILTPLVYHYHERDNALVLPETAESRIGNPAILGTRWRQGQMTWFQKLKYKIWILLNGEPKAE